MTHVLTEDKSTLAKYISRFNATGQTMLVCVLLAEGFDDAWFHNGLRGLLAPE